MERCHLSVFFLLLSFVIGISGSEIHFSSTGSIMPLLTGNLTMICSLNETTPPTSIGAVVGRRDVSLTKNNVHPMSIFIVRGNGEKVASLTQFSPAESLISDNNIYVSGKFDGNPVSQGYLEVRWEYPTLSEVSDYKCEVSTLTDEGHGIIFSKNVSLGVSTPTIDDLVKHIHKIELKSHQQFTLLKTETQTQITTLKNENQALNTKLQTSLTEIDRLKKIDTGFIDCGNSRQSNWSDGYNLSHRDKGRIIEKNQTFNMDYDKPPIVFLSILEPDYWAEIPDKSPAHKSRVHKNPILKSPVQFGIELKRVEKNSFVVQCFTENFRGSYLNQMRASWISFSS